MLPFNIVCEKLKTGLLAGFLMLLQACVSGPQTVSLQEQLTSLPAYLPLAHEIADVAFFPQEDFFCGPTTLAEILNFYGRDVSPEQIAPDLFIPDRKGSLQIEMVSSIRQYGMLAYAERGDLLQLLSLVSDDIPVIVLQNQGVSWLPSWHYALVIGYDLPEGKIILHTGKTERRLAPMDLFESTWRKGGFWLLAAVPPQTRSNHFDSLVFVSAAQDLLEIRQEQSAVMALESATEQWQDDWLSYFLLGNHYLADNPARALFWFKKGLGAGSTLASYMNNYAYALLGNGCKVEAQAAIQRALSIEPNNAAIQDSARDISQARSPGQVCEI